ncbi:hypothetical protein EDD16DRAFT_1721330 [Pisolithus croceorrhizus]|nr:hypothetical protein EDD16DRAFT_1721330 [Pisolithus croceorrhizus]KAI6117749.1 hypothetical protein EV401DRAFT_2072302 [Pisolithus croceorrhizus]KAI6159751.1 hypothetical protein EDD17DRAFT_1762216 [Pisolithus thermaeus]
MPKRSRKVQAAIANLQTKKPRLSLEGERQNNPPIELGLDTIQCQSESSVAAERPACVALTNQFTEHSNISGESESSDFSDDSLEISDSPGIEMESDNGLDCSLDFYEPEVVEGYEELNFPSESSTVQPQSTEPTKLPWHSIEYHTPPTVDAARLALEDLGNILRPPHISGYGYSAPAISHSLEKQLSWVECFICAFTNGTPWLAAALKTAKFIGKGPYMARQLHHWVKCFILDQENLPSGKHCASMESVIKDEDLREEILTHL